MEKQNYKKFVISATAIIISTMTVGGILGNNIYMNYKEKTKIMMDSEMKKIKKLEIENKKLQEDLLGTTNSLVVINNNTLKKHILNNYNNISKIKKLEILDTIMKESKKNNINPLLVYSICHRESSMNYLLKHDKVKLSYYKPFLKDGKIINEDKKTVAEVNAVGIMGIIYEIWGKLLIQNKIIETKMDLYDPVNNIKAGIFILKYYENKKQLKDTKTKLESAALRFYGVLYTNKTRTKLNKTYWIKLNNFISTLYNFK